ncbi:MAG: hypothetical protein D6815_00945 [Candidatus Dadabacteria bacterium]|nr:MAG: hypothetical protein D6815_00945 [Candidatus Dadabacteria bacterium]
MKRVHAILFGAGLLLLAYLVARTGPARLWADVERFGWGLALFVALEAVADVFHSFGMRLAFARGRRTVPLAALWGVRNAGTAVNYLTPTASIGGEVAKVALLERWIPRSAAAAGVMVDKLSYVAAQLGLAGLGTAVLAWWIPLDRRLASALFVTGAAVGIGCFGFFWFQLTGRMGWLVRRVLGRRLGEQALKVAGDVDEDLRAYYREHPWALVASILWHVAGLAVGIGATWLFLWWVVGRASWLFAAAIWMIGTLIDIAAFAVPAGVGAQEGGRMLVFALLGLPQSAGLSYGVVLRIEQIFYAGLGMLLFPFLIAGRTAAIRARR